MFPARLPLSDLPGRDVRFAPRPKGMVRARFSLSLKQKDSDGEPYDQYKIGYYGQGDILEVHENLMSKYQDKFHAKLLNLKTSEETPGVVWWTQGVSLPSGAVVVYELQEFKDQKCRNWVAVQFTVLLPHQLSWE